MMAAPITIQSGVFDILNDLYADIADLHNDQMHFPWQYGGGVEIDVVDDEDRVLDPILQGSPHNLHKCIAGASTLR
jgi:hypothetical protein